jgi:hypothetical protein
MKNCYYKEPRRKDYPHKINEKKWDQGIGLTLRKNCLLQIVIEGKLEG